MQHPTLQIRDKLLTGLDRDYNVVDMAVVIDVLSQLENIPITKEALEVSRLGKHINELRRKSCDPQLANRAKSLVKKWRQLLVVNANSENSHVTLVNGNVANGQTPSKPSSRLTSPMSEASKCNVGLSPALRHPGTGLSSLPSSASTSPGLPPSRPTTPMAGSKPVSPYLRGGGGVVNNKRSRCDDENGGPTDVVKNGPRVTREPSAKRPRLNGNATHNHLITEDSLQSEDSIFTQTTTATTNNHVSAFDDETTTTTLPATPRIGDVTDAAETRSSRRKNRAKEEVQDGLMQRMASIRKSAGKVRTTQELVQEMALRSASPALVNNRPPAIVTTPNDLNEESKTELLNRFLKSQNEATSSPPLSDASPEPEPEVDRLERPETVEDVLSRLPPIDAEAVLAELEEEGEGEEDEDDELDVEGLIPPMPKPVPDTGPEVLQQLHEGKKESFSGNFSHDGEFKEWFEVVSKRTKDDELLYILPYCVID